MDKKDYIEKSIKKNLIKDNDDDLKTETLGHTEGSVFSLEDNHLKEKEPSFIKERSDILGINERTDTVLTDEPERILNEAYSVDNEVYADDKKQKSVKKTIAKKEENIKGGVEKNNEENDLKSSSDLKAADDFSRDNYVSDNQSEKKIKSDILGIGESDKDKGYQKDHNKNANTKASNVTGLNKKAVKDKVSEMKKQKRKEADARYREIERETTAEGTTSAMAGDAGGFTVATAKKGANKVGHVAKKSIDTATDVMSSPETMIKSYSKVKTKKEQVENMDVAGVAKDVTFLFGRVVGSLVKSFFKYVMYMYAVGLISVLLIGLCFWSIVFIIAAEADDDDSETETIVETETDETQAAYTYDGNWVFINQGDYSNVSMGEGQTVSRSGCGLTCLASVLATYKENTNITPATVVNYANVHNMPRLSSGAIAMSDSLCRSMCAEYGIKYSFLTKSASAIEEVLNSGGCVIVWMSSSSKWTDGTFVTTGRHYILLMSYSSDGIIACMNSSGGRLCYIKESTIISDSATTNIYAFWKN